MNATIDFCTALTVQPYGSLECVLKRPESTGIGAQAAFSSSVVDRLLSPECAETRQQIVSTQPDSWIEAHIARWKCAAIAGPLCDRIRDSANSRPKNAPNIPPLTRIQSRCVRVFDSI